MGAPIKYIHFIKIRKVISKLVRLDSDEHKTLKAAEESAEDARLLYVALTRAKYQCNVVVFPEAISGNPDKSAFGWLLTDGKVIPSGTSKQAVIEKAEYFEAYNQSLQSLIQSNPHISLNTLPDYPAELKYQQPVSDEKLVARHFTAEIKKQAHITSFSGLTAGAHAETPDYDSIADSMADSLQMNKAEAQNTIDGG